MVTRQQEKSLQTRQEIMNAAEELFCRNGFLNTTVAEITTRAGYAKGSFYSHFESKDRMFLAIVEQKLKAYRNARDARLETARNFVEAMHVIWDFLETMVEDHNWAKVLLEFTISAARDPELRQEMHRKAYRLSEAVFAELIRDHVDADLDLEKLGAMNTVLFEGFMVHNALEIGVLSLKDIREAAVTLALAWTESRLEKSADKAGKE